MKSSLYTQLLLTIFGVLLGLLLLGGLYGLTILLGISSFGIMPSEATHFDSIEEFHQTMFQRDERDTRSSESVSLRSIITPHPNEMVLYDLLPNQAVYFQKVPVRTNRCGMRGPDVQIEKPPHVVRVAFLGDSFTFGWGVEEDQTFVSVVSEVLNRFARDRGVKVEVLNFGVPGYSTFQEVERFLSSDIEFRPDIVVVFFIDNDFGLPFFIRGHGTDGRMVTSSDYDRMAQNSENEAVRADRAKIVNRLDPNRALRRLVKASKLHDFRPFIAFNPHPNWRESFKKLWFLRESKGLGVIEFREEFLRAVEQFGIPHNMLTLPDDPHPSGTKHAILGGLIAEALLPEVDMLSSQISEDF